MSEPAAQPEHASIERPLLTCGDWLELAPMLAPNSLDLIYVDPPFNTGRVFHGQAGSFRDQFDSPTAFIEWLRARFIATLPALKPTGSLLLHLDWRTSHFARVMLDELLGADRFVNHLIWSYGLGGSSPRCFARKHDDILFYCRDPALYYFVAPRTPAKSARMKGMSKKMTDVLDIASLNNMADERVGYPTQKPLALLTLLVESCSPSGGTVLDPCCGSGTTLVAAQSLSRSGIGFDISPDAIEVAAKRVSTPALRPQGQQPLIAKARRKQMGNDLPDCWTFPSV